jgi:membrane-associated protease RseP (regulator of RpoE activity)
MGHYWVAKRHGFSLSLPFFIPFPFAFGTLGAVIRLRSMPKSRNALLEMGAAGPIAGFVAAAIIAWFGMQFTENHKVIELPIALQETFTESLATSESDWLTDTFVFLGILPEIQANNIPMTILSDPLLLKVTGYIHLNEPLSPYAEIHPMAFASWVGCLLTAINMLPVGQLDGGHICHALFPKKAPMITRVCIIILFFGAILWLGWLVWAVLLSFMGATKGIRIYTGEISFRAKCVAFGAILSFLLSFMIQPVRIENVSLEDIRWIEEGKQDVLDILEEQ